MTHAPPLPSSSRDLDLDEAVSVLSARNDAVGVVRLVEAWTAQGTPTRRARLAEARAFFDLRLMDRALTRTREVLDADPTLQDALALQVRIYLERGWPIKARKPLQQLEESGRDDLAELRARAFAEPTRPEANARDIEREAKPDKLLALAEAFLATGSFLRATGILERLRRNEPENPRVKELLWALAGEYVTDGQALDVLRLSLVPPAAAPARDLGFEEPEHTESFDLHASDLDPETAEATAFPSLFKHAGMLTVPTDDPHEATMTSGLASASEMVAETKEVTDPGRELVDVLHGSNPSDTQIMLVLRPGEGRPNVAHRRREDGDEGEAGLKETLNLRAWQESMGMSSASDLADAPDDLLEEEDENVVVMTRDEAPAVSAPLPTENLFKPIEVVEKHGTPINPPEEPISITPDFEPEPEPAPPSRLLPRLLVAAVAVAFAGALFVGAIALGGLASRSSGGSARDELVRALSMEDYNALLTQEGRLEQRIAAGVRPSEIADVRASLTETRLVLWSDYNGDPTRLSKVNEGLGSDSRLDAHRLSVLRAAEALARNDLAGATSSLGRERPTDDEERLLYARIAARSGDIDRAIEHFDAIDRPDSARYRLARAEVCAAAGRAEEAESLVRAVLAENPDHAAANILALELAAGSPEQLIEQVDTFLQSPAGTGLAPRLEGRLEVVRARAWLTLGNAAAARTAVERGLSKDGANPDLLFLRAADLATSQKLTSALHELTNVIAARPGTAAAQTAYILLLLDLDRADEAEDAVTRLEAASMLPGLTPVLDTLVSVVGLQERPLAEMLPPQRATTLGTIAEALLAAQERSPSAPDALLAAAEAASASADPFERRLYPRLLAQSALVLGGPDGEERAKEALALAPEDPAVHVYVARLYEGADKKALAAQHFDRAAQLGPELGLAWYEKGRFYLDARDGFARSGAAWRNFLALAPSGPRATRAKDTLGVR